MPASSRCLTTRVIKGTGPKGPHCCVSYVSCWFMLHNFNSCYVSTRIKQIMRPGKLWEAAKGEMQVDPNGTNPSSRILNTTGKPSFSIRLIRPHYPHWCFWPHSMGSEYWTGLDQNGLYDQSKTALNFLECNSWGKHISAHLAAGDAENWRSWTHDTFLMTNLHKLARLHCPFLMISEYCAFYHSYSFIMFVLSWRHGLSWCNVMCVYTVSNTIPCYTGIRWYTYLT